LLDPCDEQRIASRSTYTQQNTSQVHYIYIYIYINTYIYIYMYIYIAESS